MVQPIPSQDALSASRKLLTATSKSVVGRAHSLRHGSTGHPDSSSDLCQHTSPINGTLGGSLKSVYECADKADMGFVRAERITSEAQMHRREPCVIPAI